MSQPQIQQTWTLERLRELQPPRPAKGVMSDAVWPEQPPEACEYVFVGEAPGRTEVSEGKPFVGTAGRLLRTMVDDLGLRGRVHYTNASLYRPQHGSEAGDARPSLSALRAERPRLNAEILGIRPKAVIALGASAALALVPKAYRVRGRVINATWLGFEFPVYLTWHPAYVFRDPNVYPDICEDIQRASRLDVPKRVQEDIKQRLVIPSSEAQIDFVGDMLVVDIETNGLPVHLSTLRVAVFQDAERYWVCTPATVSVFREAIQRFNGRIIGHNTIGDEACLRKSGIDIRFTDDTLLHHAAHDSRRGSHGLKTLAPVIGGSDTACDLIAPYVGKGLSFSGDDAGGWAAIPGETLAEYCAGDTAGTKAVAARLDKDDDGRTKKLYSFLMRGQRCFTEGLVRGIRIDQGLLAERYSHYADRVARLKAGFNFDPDSHLQTLQALRASGFMVSRTDKATLAALDGPLPTQLRAYRKESKVFNGFLKPLKEEWVGADGILHPLHKLYGTDTGRTSSSEPNVQQVTEALKALFVARPGYVFVGWDFKAHEVRGLAYATGDHTLIDMLRDPNADPHSVVGHAAGVDRAAGKRGVFGRAYRASRNKLMSTGLYPSLEAVDRVIATVDAMMPGIGAWQTEMLRQMEEVGYIETPFGRRRYFPYIDRRNRHHLENVACNYPIQSLCNDIALSTAFGETGIYTAFGLPSLLFVHDFNLVEVPEKEAEDVAKYVEQIDPYPNGRVRFYPEVHIADTWGGLKNAKAAAVDIGDPTGSDGTGASDSDDREGGANDTNVDSE